MRLIVGLLAGLCAAMSSALSQDADAPPERLPSGARMGDTALQLNGASLQFGTTALMLPGGFGAGQPALADAGPARAVATPNAPAQVASMAATSSGDPFFDPASGIPGSLPAGARFASATLSFGGSAVAFGQSSAGLRSGGAAFGSGAAGLAVREESGGALRFTLAADVLFDFDKWALRRDAGAVLDTLMAEVRARVAGAARFTVEGHTDWIGSDAYNDRLSNRRAGSVKTWLTKNGGVSASSILTVGYGERRPVAPNAKPDGSDDPEGRQKNRRVELLVVPRP
jgi:outer membrane protein OmpA-like peptidoglycan-associated protein